MKLLSVSLVVTTLAAIAGSAIAAPGPLHVRALDTINSLGRREVDVNGCESDLALLEREVEFVDELSTRDDLPDPESVGEAAKEHEEAASVWTTAAELASNPEQAGLHRKSAERHTEERNNLQNAKDALIKGEASDEQKSLAKKWEDSMKDAVASASRGNRLLGSVSYVLAANRRRTQAPSNEQT